MKNLYSLIFSIVILLAGSDGIYAQVSSEDFQFSERISSELKAPSRIAIDNNDNVYVTDAYQHKINKFDASGNLVSSVTVSVTPISIAINSDNEIFIGDSESGSIFRLNENGSTTIYYPGSSFPNAMSFSPDNHLYISDSKQHKVLVLDTDGSLVQVIGEGTLIFPTGISYDKKNHRIIVGEHGADNDNLQTRIYIYALDGTLINLLGSYGNGNAKFYRVQGVTAGRCGNIYICEPFQGSISVYKENGFFLTKFGQFGQQPGELNLPMDIAFDSQEKIWISSMNNGSLEVFTIDDPSPSASILTQSVFSCEGQTAEITVKLTGTPPWDLTYTHNGQNPQLVTNIGNSPHILNVSLPGIYHVTALQDAVSAGSCFSGSASVTMNPAPSAEFLSPNITICEGQTAEVPLQFTGSSPWSFTYLKDGSNPVTINNISANPYFLELTEAGIYTLSSFSNADCDGIILQGTTQVTVNPRPQSGFNYFVNDLTVSLINSSTNATYYYWNFGDQQSSTQPNPVHSYSHSGEYKVSLSTWNDNCRGLNFTQMVTVSSSNDTSAFDNNNYQKLSIPAAEEISIELYPNPSRGFFTLRVNQDQLTGCELEITNMTGQLVCKKSVDLKNSFTLSNKPSEQIDVSHLTNGVYSVKVTAGDVIQAIRLVINK
ncbi:MAG: T9SS type A sorting domain-containing protein [Bacteroidales bacterium]